MKNDHSPTVFIVDDDEAVRFAITMLVESCGWIAEEFSSAREFLHTRQSNGKNGCLVLDLNMADMDGAELVEELIETLHWIPIIVVTGYADGPLAGRVREAGVRAVLKKPFNDRLLLGHIRKALEIE